LVFINSAGFGLGRKVDSISQALVLAGWKPLKAWLKIVLLTSMAASPRHEEYCYYAAQRADFLQRAARAANMERLVPSLSLLGLLSHLEPILEMPPAQALAEVPVADAIKVALLGGDTPFRAWLDLARAMEQANWELAERIGKSAGLRMADLARCYHESFSETDTLFRNLPPATPVKPAKHPR
jgi:EAL and modified HD-GYP domain-containing signal transduction protein